MFKRLTRARFARAGIASAVIAAAVIVAVSSGALSGAGKSQAAPGDMTMTVTNPASAAVGGTFVAQVIAGNPSNTTYSGWSMEMGYDPSKLTALSDTAAGLGGCSGGSFANASLSPTVVDGCFGQVQTNAGAMDNITFQCVGYGSSALTLITSPPGAYGSNFNDEFAAPIATDLTSSSVTCNLPITKTADAGPHLAGGQVTYTVHVGNPTASSIGGLMIADSVPAPLTVSSVSSTNGVLDGCSAAPANPVVCTSATADSDPVGFDLIIVADIPLSAAGQNGLNNCAQLDPLNNGPVSCAAINVAPASLTVTKVADQASVQAGDPISWTITVTSNGPSPADGVIVTDTPTDGWVPNSPVSFSPGLMAPSTSVTYVVTGNVTDPNPTDNTCDNSVSATSTNGASASASASTDCLSKNVRMVKSTDGLVAPTNSGGLVNLFLNKTCGPSLDQLCPLDVYEWALNVGGDPDGVGAFEFQVKYDNHLFDISIEATNWLYDTGRVPGATGIGGCAATIYTENDIRFGCVSKNPVDGNGDPIITTGNLTNGVIAIIHVTPKADLVNRITPGNDNGAIRSLLDEGCEFADIWGHPLSTNGLDALGREILLPGVGPGGVILDCADITITVRILEGDMNLDCSVTVADDQIEASHYGSFFGNLLYQPWYDLEPWLKDGDVDIKDLQKVFGRNGSTCANPIPAQPALPEPVDP